MQPHCISVKCGSGEGGGRLFGVTAVRINKKNAELDWGRRGERFTVSNRKNFCTVKVIKHRDGLPTKVVDDSRL